MSMGTFHAALLMAPYYPCFWTLEKSVSVQVLFDGGKWLCGLDELKASASSRDAASHASSRCVVYSLGSNFNTVFEDHVSAATAGACDFFIFDPTMAVTHSQSKLDAWRKKLPPNYYFREMGIVGNSEATNVSIRSVYGGGQHSYPATTLEGAMHANGNCADGVCWGTMLKVDIDGFELDLLRATNWHRVRFGLVLFEIHAQQHSSSGPSNSLSFAMAHTTFVALERAGYRIYSAEPVWIGRNGLGSGSWEIGLIHRDWNPHMGFSAPCSNLPNVTGAWP